MRQFLRSFWQLGTNSSDSFQMLFAHETPAVVKLVKLVKLGNQPLPSGQAISIDDDALHLIPVDLWEIDPKPNPTSRSKVGGYVKALGFEVGETLVRAGFSFAIESYAPVAVMVVEIVAESFSANLKAQVLVTCGGDGSLWQRLHQRYDTRPSASDYRAVRA